MKTGHKSSLKLILSLTAILLSLLIMLSQAFRLSEAMSLAAAEASATASLPSPALETPSAEALPTSLTVSSTESELYISVLDMSGSGINGTKFELSVTSPDGNSFIYHTREDGTCHIVDLEPGTYSISMEPASGYEAAETVKCTVISTVERVFLPNDAHPGSISVPSSNETQPLYGWQREDGQTYFYNSSGRLLVGLYKIDGKLFYFNERGELARELGIDVSYYNEGIDWRTVKEQGIDFALIRLGGRGWGSGNIYNDTKALKYLHDAADAGLDVGVYFYSTATNANEAVQEAEAVLEKLSGMKLDYPIFIDMEYSGEYPRGRADTLSIAERVEIINAFCAAVNKSGYSAGFYSGQYFINAALDYDSIAQHCIWLANYTYNNALPSFSGRYDIWQFTDRGTVNGIIGPVDMNVIF